MISVIVPTYNEGANIAGLIEAVKQALDQAALSDFEILIMDDDSPDGTAALVNGMKDPRVHAVNRKGRPRGLSAAVIDGFGEARGGLLAVMDADFSHPPDVLPRLFKALLEEGADLAIGSRYVPGGGITNWPWKRRVTSRVACWLARPVTRVKDATSGFFALKKKSIEGVSLNPWGFKIGLEVAVKARHGGRFKEVPFVFTDRRAGESKLGTGVMFLYLKQLLAIFFSKS